MNILQVGKAKSGNFWLYKIIQNILFEANKNNSSFIVKHPKYEQIKNLKLSTQKQNVKDVIDINDDGIYFRVSSIFREKICDFNNYLKYATHVWSHSKYSKNTEFVLNNFDKVVYIIRDPRDIILSMGNFVLTDYMKKYYPNKYKTQKQYVKYNIINQSVNWHNHICDYLRITHSNFYIIFYENFLYDFNSELNNLLNFFNLELSVEQRNKIQANCNAENMLSTNPDHVNIPELYKWKRQLSERDNDKVISYLRNSLNGLNYNIYFDQENKLPFLYDLNFCQERLNLDFYGVKEKLIRKTLM